MIVPDGPLAAAAVAGSDIAELGPNQPHPAAHSDASRGTSHLADGVIDADGDDVGMDTPCKQTGMMRSFLAKVKLIAGRRLGLGSGLFAIRAIHV